MDFSLAQIFELKSLGFSTKAAEFIKFRVGIFAFGQATKFIPQVIFSLG
jgi:hypothetical protein